MKVITKNNVVIAITTKAEWVINGIKTEDCIIGVSKENDEFTEGYTISDLTSVPDEVKIQKYCYDGTSFSINPEYIEPIDEKYEALKAENVALRNDLSSAVIELSSLIALGGM